MAAHRRKLGVLFLPIHHCRQRSRRNRPARVVKAVLGAIPTSPRSASPPPTGLLRVPRPALQPSHRVLRSPRSVPDAPRRVPPLPLSLPGVPMTISCLLNSISPDLINAPCLSISVPRDLTTIPRDPRAIPRPPRSIARLIIRDLRKIRHLTRTWVAVKFRYETFVIARAVAGGCGGG